MTVYVIPVDVSQPITEFQVKKPGHLDADELKILVGGSLDKYGQMINGWFQIVPEFTNYEGKKCIVLANEEGKVLGMPTNVRATDLWKKLLEGRSLRYVPELNGPIAIITSPEMDNL